ncbi:hypothetical protein EMIHUDRAFT_225203 [Emiliania huxleyi CCMP1516]|uniref:MAM domain-containing protein n=2 Tax=Emiliania huxleyi TaxID=2903 RepID=A0A0D3KPF5_EMIH1|nr:hypothetical protein EMIHUDRAFT_225203 [Emiliania huxleyi CCMP1516]EOD37640.1 hypothetical protein EMIHUDRAFT_225203 [Emiliania huxleyi CCMP1516]|eukprot:XP_005790069.1 hypothetical protein EMIHUDRAFT_225203 [Emiliania huxleyi CCMP1516]
MWTSATKLAELKRLLDEGALTREEFELLKAREIGGSAPPPYEQGVVMGKTQLLWSLLIISYLVVMMSVVCLILIELSPYERCCIEISGWCKAVLQLLSSGHLLGVAVALLSFDAKGYSVGCAAAARSNFKVLKVLLLGSQDFVSESVGKNSYRQESKAPAAAATELCWCGYCSKFGTPTLDTGPSGDHTTGSGSYLFTEASGIYNALHQLESPLFSLQQDAALSFTFFYHMYAEKDSYFSSMGTLSVEVNNNETGWSTLWSGTGPVASDWRNAAVVLPASATRVRINGLTGPSFESDMALDDLGCDFEVDTCVWFDTAPDGYSWTRTSGFTPSGGTGPG